MQKYLYEKKEPALPALFIVLVFLHIVYTKTKKGNKKNE